MRLVHFFRPRDRYEGVGYLEDDRVIDLSRGLKALRGLELLFHDLGPTATHCSILDMLREEDRWRTGGYFAVNLFHQVREFIAKHSLEQDLTIEAAKLLAPIPNPPRIIALGLNYAAHAAEGGRKPPKEPIFFVKASTAVIGPDEPVICPTDAGRIDHEVELAVIVGKRGRRISRKKAKDYIAGYTILNDVTARDIQKRDMAASNPWFLSKSFDTFAPMGPCITLPDEIQEPCELDLSLRVNGEVRQKSNTRDLIFSATELIHRLSRHITLEPGDVVSTGTPAGISPIKPGDVMEAEIERIGVLRNPVFAGR